MGKLPLRKPASSKPNNLPNSSSKVNPLASSPPSERRATTCLASTTTANSCRHSTAAYPKPTPTNSRSKTTNANSPHAGSRSPASLNASKSTLPRQSKPKTAGIRRNTTLATTSSSGSTNNRSGMCRISRTSRMNSFKPKTTTWTTERPSPRNGPTIPSKHSGHAPKTATVR